MPAPTFIQEAETTWDTAGVSKTTASFSVLAGDVLVAYAISEGDQGGPHGISGGSLTWTNQQSSDLVNYTSLDIWTTVVDTNKSMTVTFSPNISGQRFGGNVLTFRGCTGIGASAKTTNASGAPSLDLTTTEDSSVIVVANGDWQGDLSAQTWRTVNGITPTAGNGETSYYANTLEYGVYGAYYSDAGTAGTKTVGLSAPGGQKYSIVAVEIKGATFPTNNMVLDTFNRTDTTSIGGSTSSSGNIWDTTQIQNGTATGLGISSNVLYYSNSVGNNAYLATQFGPNSEVYVEVPTLPNNTASISLYARIQTPGSAAFDCYYLTYTHATSGNATWILARYTDGASTVISSLSTAALSAGNTLGLEISGTGATVTLKAYKKVSSTWSLVNSGTDTSGSRITAAGYLGIEIEDITTRLDNFSGGTVGGTYVSNPNFFTFFR